MKMKTRISLCALALTVAALSGCAGSNQKTSFSNYWNQNALVFEQIHETLVYDVTFEKGSTHGYDLSYENGIYTTELISGADENGQNFYTYKTELSIDVTYTFEGTSKTLTDNVKTEVTFLTAENGLRPLSSKKSIVSTSPMTSIPTALENCYLPFEYKIETVYTENGGETKVTHGESKTTQSFEMDKNGYSYLDNEQVLFALRAIPTSTSSTRFSAYSPFTDSVQKIAVAFSASANGEFEFSKNGSAVKEKIDYRPVQIQLDEKNKGFAQTAWIATTTDVHANPHRNVMLRLETPLYQGLGVLIYQLSSVSYQ